MTSGTVLVAAGDPVTRRVVATVLEQAGLGVVSAQDGTTALELVRARRPDAVVLAHQLPGLTGLEVLAAVREDEDVADVPVVVLTAVGAEPLPGDPIAAGAAAHLEVPCSPLHLLESLTPLLGQSA